MIVSEVRIYGLEPPNSLTNENIRIECDYRIDPDVIKKVCEMHQVEPNMLVGLRLDTGNGLTVCDIANAIIEDGRTLGVDMLHEKQCTISFSCILPTFCQGQYFISPVVSLGLLDRFVALCGYDNLVLLNCIPTRKVLGLLRPNYKITRKA